MNKQKRYAIFERLRGQNPHPTTELHYDSPFELLIAVILSAQATDISVNKATQQLFPLANTPEAILALGEEKLKEHIKTIGLFNSKATHIIKTCQLLIEKHHGEIPKTRVALEALSGVGRKTANKEICEYDRTKTLNHSCNRCEGLYWSTFIEGLDRY